jgi:hypothetical protein
MRTAAAVLVFCLPAAAADRLLPDNMAVGKVGPLWPDGHGLPGAADVVRYTIAEVGDDWLALRVTGAGGPSVILVRGVDTKGLVNDRRWKPAGEWKVTATEKYRGKTRFVLRPEK